MGHKTENETRGAHVYMLCVPQAGGSDISRKMQMVAITKKISPCVTKLPHAVVMSTPLDIKLVGKQYFLTLS